MPVEIVSKNKGKLTLWINLKGFWDQISKIIIFIVHYECCLWNIIITELTEKNYKNQEFFLTLSFLSSLYILDISSLSEG